MEWCVVDTLTVGPRVTRWSVLFCPALTPVEYYPSTPFPIDLEVQTLRTADGHELTINASIMVVIDDPVTMREAIGFDDYVSNISMEARATIQEFISGHNLQYGLESMARLEEDLADNLTLLTLEGVHLERLCIEDAAGTTALRFYGIPSAATLAE